MIAAAAIAACGTKFSCPNGTTSVDGLCRIACSSDGDCLVSEACTDGACVVRADDMPIIVSFSASSASVEYDKSVTLEWAVLHASAIEISAAPAVEGSPHLSTNTEGELKFGPLRETTTFSLRASGKAREASASVIVSVNAEDVGRVTEFTITPTEIDPGSTAIAEWKTTGADRVAMNRVGEGEIDFFTRTQGAANHGFAIILGENDRQIDKTITYRLAAYGECENVACGTFLGALRRTLTVRRGGLSSGTSYCATTAVRSTAPSWPSDGGATVEFQPYAVLGPGNNGAGFAVGPLPFEFTFFGHVYRGVVIHANGYITFLPDYKPYEDAAFGTIATPNAVIAPFAANLVAGEVKAGVLGDGRAAVEFSKMRPAGDAINSQDNLSAWVILESGGDIVIRYTSRVADGLSVHAGIEDENGNWVPATECGENGCSPTDLPDAVRFYVSHDASCR